MRAIANSIQRLKMKSTAMSRNSILEYLKKDFQISGNFDLACAVLENKFESVLDVGTGSGAAAIFFAMAGKSVTSIGLELQSYDYPESLFDLLNITLKETALDNYSPDEKYDAIWASHVLEHNQNPGLFFEKTLSLLNDEGYLFLMVPPYKEEVVGGHVTNGWNMGQVMYNLLLAGYDIKSGSFISHGYNIFAAVKSLKSPLPPLRHDAGDIETLAPLWPIPMTEGMIVDKRDINWHWPEWMQERLRAPTHEKFVKIKQELEEAQHQISLVKQENKLLTSNKSETQAYNNKIEDLEHKLEQSYQLLALKTNSNKQLKRMLQAKNK